MKRSLIRSYLLSILILLLVFSAVAYHYTKTAIEHQTYDQLVSDLHGFDLYLSEHEEKDIDTLCHSYGAITLMRITAIAEDGTVLGDSQNNKDVMTNHKNRPEVIEAKDGGIGYSKRYSNTEKTDYIYTAKLTAFQNAPLIIRTSNSVSMSNDFLTAIILGLIVSLVIALALSLVSVFRFTKVLTKPIQEIRQQAKQIAEGDYGIKVYTKSYDEVTSLSTSINKMSMALQSSFDSLSLQNAQMETILQNLETGIMVTDMDGNIKYANDTFYHVLERKKTNRQYNIYDFLFDNVIFELLDELKEHGGTVSKENVEFLGGKYRSYETTYITSEEGLKGILLIVRDVTNLNHLEKLRSEFVSNVTHELKTPITSIYGFAQTLLSGAYRDETVAKKFLTIIESESSRLNHLVDDILTIQTYEHEKTPKHLSVDVLAVAKECIEIVRYTVKDDVTLSLSFDEESDYIVLATPDKIKQILLNLLSNSIKFTSHGSVTLQLEHKEESIVISVMDTGIGIDKNHHKRLFERFYRVDAHRSREEGGTGLGLSIVKHIVLSLGGNIALESKPNLGTTISITLPKYPSSQPIEY